MKYVLLAGVIVGGVMAWRIGERLSADSIAMGIGVLFGVLAGIPMSLLVMATQRREPKRTEDDADPRSRHYLPQQSPVIVLTGASYATVPNSDRPDAQQEALLSCNGTSHATWRLLPGANDREDWQ